MSTGAQERPPEVHPKCIWCFTAPALIHPLMARKNGRETLITQRFLLERIGEAYDVFGQQRDGVLKVANP